MKKLDMKNYALSNMTKENSYKTIEKKKKEKSLKEMMDAFHENYKKHKEAEEKREYENYRKRLEYERLEHNLNSF